MLKSKISPMYVQCRIEGSGKSTSIFIPERYGTKGNVFQYSVKDPKGNILTYEVCVMDVGANMPFDTILNRGYTYIHNKAIVKE